MLFKFSVNRLIIGIILGSILIFPAVFYYGIYAPYRLGAGERFFIIQRGQNLLSIADNLEKDGLVRNKFPFIIYVLIRQKQNGLQAGKYLLSPAMNAKTLARKIINGEVIKHEIKIIEGWNLMDIGAYLEKEGLFSADDFFRVVGAPLVMRRPEDLTDEFAFLKDKPQNISLEGYLFPDTYEIPDGASSLDAVKIILMNFGKKLTPDLRKEISGRNKTIFEIITMASLLEKEAQTYEDKRIVAGILWKRLDLQMPLQVDATVGYILGKKTTKISAEDAKIDSSYNTYKYRGLPVGPIANPGMESIFAALRPKETDYLYYLSTPDGKIIFSRTLKEHNEAKAKYLK